MQHQQPLARRGHVVRIEQKRGVKGGQRFGHAVAAVQRHRPSAVAGGVARGQRDRSLVDPQRLARMPEAEQRPAEIEPAGPHPGSQFRPAPQRRQPVRPLADAHEENPQVGGAFAIGRFEPHGSAQVHLGWLITPCLRERQAQAHVGGGGLGQQTQGRFQPRASLLRPAQLQQRSAAQVQDPVVARGERTQALVRGEGLGQTPGLVVGGGGGELRLDPGGTAWWGRHGLY